MLNPNGTWGYLYVQNGAPLIEQLSCEFFELKPFSEAIKEFVMQVLFRDYTDPDSLEEYMGRICRGDVDIKKMPFTFDIVNFKMLNDPANHMTNGYRFIFGVINTPPSDTGSYYAEVEIDVGDTDTDEYEAISLACEYDKDTNNHANLYGYLIWACKCAVFMTLLDYIIKVSTIALALGSSDKYDELATKYSTRTYINLLKEQHKALK